MEVLKDVFGMPLFPHLYAIPLSVALGIAIGYALRGKIEPIDDDGIISTAQKPPKPQIDETD